MKTTSYNGKKYAFDKAPRCGAKTKNNHGLPCQSPAVKEKHRCRLHGGAKGSGAKMGNKNALKHGETTSNMKEFRKTVRQVIRESKFNI